MLNGQSKCMVKYINILNFKTKHTSEGKLWVECSHPKGGPLKLQHNLLENWWCVLQQKGFFDIYLLCLSKQMIPQHNSKSLDLVQHEQME